MGKDSKLVEYLVKKNTDNYRVIFNNTTCDSLDVYKEVSNRKNIEIINVKDKNGKNLSLYNMAKEIGFATRHCRWCCSIFKENSVKKYLGKENNIIEFLGIRNEESMTRKNYQDEKNDDRFSNNINIILPIRKWVELELWLYTIHNKISINSKYLKGYNRVGCHICCPFYTKSTWILDKYWYKNQFDRFHNLLEYIFLKKEGWCWSNGTLEEYHLNWNGGQVRETPTEEVINEFKEYKGFGDYKLAEQYFNKKCICCNKNVYKKDEVAMNLKLFGRNINKFRCKKCLMKEMNWNKEDWKIEIDKFKEQECKLF